MCGILFTNNPNYDTESFKNALNLMEKRGPDAYGYQNYGYNQLGHRRLKIIDLDDRSNQPFISRCGRYVVIYNGEIYNFNELSKKFKIDQETSCDTEILVELFVLLGASLLDELNGMFAFLIFDKRDHTFFAARDRLGIKPIYYAMQNDYITISSEIAPIIDLMGTPDFDEIGLRQYRKLRACYNGRTIYKNISMFPAAHFCFNGNFTKYWNLPTDRDFIISEEEIKETIISAVKSRCLSDVPVGSYLSGGLDSTIVACLASKPHTWTVGFKDNNEFEWARIVEKKFNFDHTEVLIDESEFLEIGKKMVYERKEPLSVPNEILIYKMTKYVKEKNTVILSGEGADELFYGYDRIFRWASSNKWDLKTFADLYSYGSNQDYEIVEEVLSSYSQYKSALKIVSYFFQIEHLHGLLRRLDNSTMSCSVEARVPFVDHRIIEKMTNAPFEYLMEGGIVKNPLKRMFKNLVPEKIIKRKKVGFPVPLNKIYPSSDFKDKPIDVWLKSNLKLLNVPNEFL